MRHPTLATALALLALAGPPASRCEGLPTARPAGSTRGVELYRIRFDTARTALRTPRGTVHQTSGDPRAIASGALALDFVLPRSDAELAFDAVVEHAGAGKTWSRVPPEEVAIEAEPPDGVEPGGRIVCRMLIATTTGWERETFYRVRFTASVRGDPTGTAERLVYTWKVKTYDAEQATAPVVTEKKLPLSYGSAVAADPTLGGRFPGGQNILFQGAWTDPLTGLAYHRGRWYDPRNGVFLSEDPMGDTDSTNLYAFVGWRPPGSADPLGLGTELLTDDEYLELSARSSEGMRTLATAAGKAWQSPYVQGPALVCGGVGEGVGGAYAAAQTVGLAAAPGWLAMTHGADVAWTGVRTTWTGELQETATRQAARAGFEAAGLSPATADISAATFDAGVSGVGLAGSARALSGLATPPPGVVVPTGAPRIHMGKQGKHIPGHHNYIEGRSILRADPESLAARAGTGEPVGRIPRGQPGFRERINFGEVIGDFVEEGAAAPTTKGIITYAADGTIHIVPVRP